MISVEFYNCCEIRMGSPFKGCQIRLEGDWIPMLPQSVTWQNVMAQSYDDRYMALVCWDTPKNEPGFRVISIDTFDRVVQQSDRILGYCQKIWWNVDKFDWIVF